MSDKVRELIEQAESSAEDDTSIVQEKRSFGSEEEAERFFDVVKRRMFDITYWDRGSTPSTYALFDENGDEVKERPIETGDFLRISIYGSGKPDWVRVINIYEISTEIVITVQPSHDPTERPPRPDVVSHFFQPTARNNFCLKRDASTLTFYVIGINEKQNTQFTSGLLETARNVAAANVGYYLGLQKGYWKEICVNMLKDDEEEKA